LSPRPRGFSLLEVSFAIGFFGLFSLILFYALQNTSKMWQRSSARDAALRQIVRARSYLTRDLMNGSGRPGQSASAHVGPSLGAGWDGDAFTVLSCEDNSTPWNINSTGGSILTREVTYSLFVPQNVNARYGGSFPGLADAQGYEDACPYKWLVRRVDPAPAAVAPSPDASIPSNWTTTLLTRPASMSPTSTTQVVATLHSFRILSNGPRWEFELRACAVDEARRKMALGAVALGSSPYVLVQRFALSVHN
jgi:hypothetical protein